MRSRRRRWNDSRRSVRDSLRLRGAACSCTCRCSSSCCTRSRPRIARTVPAAGTDAALVRSGVRARPTSGRRCGCRCRSLPSRRCSRSCWARSRRSRSRAASSAARSASRCCSCCRSRCPASSRASRCWPAFESSRPRSRLLDDRRRATRRSASSSSTTTSSRACAGMPHELGRGVDGSRRRRLPDVPLHAVAADRRPRCSPVACWRSRCRSTRSSSRCSLPVTTDAADLVLQRAVPAARAADHQRRRGHRDRS